MTNIISMVEQKMNDWANAELTERYRIKPNSFRITIKQNKDQLKPSRYGYVVQDGSYLDYMQSDNSTVVRPKRTHIIKPNDLLESHSALLATVTNGTIVQITLYIPLIDPKENDLQEQLKKTIKKMKATCKGLFKYLSNPRLHRDSELFNPTVVGDTLHEYILGADNTKVWRKSRYNTQVVNDFHRSEFVVTKEKIITYTHRETGLSFTVRDDTNTKTEWELEQQAWDMCAELVKDFKSEKVSISTALVMHGHFNTLVHPYFD